MVGRAALCSLVLLVAFPRPVEAEDEDEASRAELARRQFELGSQLAAQGRLPEAEQAFTASLAAMPRPNTYYNVALVQCRARRYADCLRTLDVFLERTDPVRDSASRGSASEIRAFALSQLGRVELALIPATAVIAGGGFGGAGSERAAYLDPGTQRIDVSAPGHRSRSVELTVVAGATQRLTIALDRDVVAAPTAQLTAGSGGDEGGRRIVPWALTLGGSGLLAGAAATGLLALHADRQVTRACPADGSECDQVGLRSTQSAASTLATVTDVLWISGALSVAVGVGWLLLDDDGERSRERVTVSSEGVRVAF